MPTVFGGEQTHKHLVPHCNSGAMTKVCTGIHGSKEESLCLLSDIWQVMANEIWVEMKSLQAKVVKISQPHSHQFSSLLLSWYNALGEASCWDGGTYKTKHPGSLSNHMTDGCLGHIKDFVQAIIKLTPLGFGWLFVTMAISRLSWLMSERGN